MLFRPGPHAITMAKAKTGSFWLTEELILDTVDTAVQGTVSLGSYVDVGDRQAIAIEEVDFIVQVFNTSTNAYTNAYQGAATGATTWGLQLSDLNPGTVFIAADDNALIASGALLYDDSNNVASLGPDLFPDAFGKLDEARMVVSDNLFFVAAFHGSAIAANRQYRVCCRIKCKIVTLSLSDFMSIAVQSSASEN